MALSYKARRRLSVVVLVIWMPIYIWLVSLAMSSISRPPIWLEIPLYLVLGIAWALPFKKVFLGVGKADPDAEE